MKKLRLLALLLAVVMCFQFVPAYAAQAKREVPETQI